jgi:V8-like Glu-specific endopeptidase
MTHRIGTMNPISPVTIGPDSGAAATSANTWAFAFQPTSAPSGTKFVILHFTGAALPAANRLEVDLGYDVDVFTNADGPDFWTRPIKVPGSGKINLRYVTNGSGSGHVVLSEYGRGEAMESVTTSSPEVHNHTNPDVFLLDSPYVEPSYELRGFCGPTPIWENIACVPSGDVRANVARSVCLFVHAEINETNGQLDLSSCTGTLIGPDLVLCAGHCVSDANDLNGHSGSVTFDFQTNCDGSRPSGYAPKFYKVNKTFRAKSQISGLDYSLLQLKTPVPGVPVVPLRHDVPKVNDSVFEVHHPQAITKKVSARHTGTQATLSKIELSNGFLYLFANCDLTGGSSGSALFDMSGRIIGIADIAGHCANGFLSITEVLKDIAAIPPLAMKRDVMLVIDRSGSMSMDAGTGRTKIDEARDAASLFVQLIRAGAGDRIGLVSFSTAATLDEALGPVDGAKKNTLVGPAPFGGGKVGALIPNGLTTIGGGLQTANGQFPAPGPGINQKTLLLLTDGLQNTPPMVADVNPMLGGVDLSVIGFGTESSLDGVLLDGLAQQHNGMYTRAGTGLQLKKFFVLAFGNIFEAGTLSDPEYDLPAALNQKSIAFYVCSEDTITAVVGWDRPDASLLIQLQTPGGNIISAGTPGVESSSGRTWMFLRVPLPIAGERDGAWQAVVFRPGAGEFPPPAIDLRFFVNVVAKGGPVLVRVNQQARHYTGDPFNPLLMLRNTNGSTPRNARVKLTASGPANSIGTLLSQTKLGPAIAHDGDVIPARQATLQTIEKNTGKPAVSYSTLTVDLFDDGVHHDGAMEPDGIFGDLFLDLLKTEGTYTFHAVASFGDTCTATREMIWSAHIDVGIDPTKSDVSVNLGSPASDGSRPGSVTINPKDKYGNNLGPGRGDAISVSGVPGTVVTGPVVDNGDGGYTVPISYDPNSAYEPGVVVVQAGRPPVVIGPKPQPKKHHGCKWKLPPWWVWLLLLALILLLLWLLE